MFIVSRPEYTTSLMKGIVYEILILAFEFHTYFIIIFQYWSKLALKNSIYQDQIVIYQYDPSS